MKKINEIFYSLQGEGRNTGRPAVFVRFSGCNLKCPFCDTKHNNGKFMSDTEIIGKINEYPCNFVVLTGGEPSLFIDSALIDALHSNGKEIAIETNGTHRIEHDIDFITLSPKFEFTDSAQIKQDKCDELKVVFNGLNKMHLYDHISASEYYIQPCDTGDSQRNSQIVKQAVRYCMEHPKWKLSLQTQKILNVR